jgi:diphthamide biosynthesis protein 3
MSTTQTSTQQRTNTSTSTTLTASADPASKTPSSVIEPSNPSGTNISSTQTQNPKEEEEAEVYDEIEIEDMTFDSALQIYHYPCPCGDRFEICIDSLRDGEDIAVCPGCSLTIRVIFDVEDLPAATG